MRSSRQARSIKTATGSASPISGSQGRMACTRYSAGMRCAPGLRRQTEMFSAAAIVTQTR